MQVPMNQAAIIERKNNGSCKIYFRAIGLDVQWDGSKKITITSK